MRKKTELEKAAHSKGMKAVWAKRKEEKDEYERLKLQLCVKELSENGDIEEIIRSCETVKRVAAVHGVLIEKIIQELNNA